VQAKGRGTLTIGRAIAAPAVVTGGGLWGGGAGTTAVGSPTARSCTTRGSNLIFSPTCIETCQDKWEISAVLLKMIENT